MNAPPHAFDHDCLQEHLDTEMQRPLKISFFVDRFPTLSETFILNQVSGLIDLGHDVRIFSRLPKQDQTCHPELEQYDLASRTFYLPSTPASRIRRLFAATRLACSLFLRHPIRTLRTLCHPIPDACGSTLRLLQALSWFAQQHFDVMQCHFGHNGNLAVPFKIFDPKCCLVAMFHGYDLRQHQHDGNLYYRRLFQWADACLAISHYSEKILLDFGLLNTKLIRHPTGIDPTLFHASPRLPPPPPHAVTILSVGRLVDDKAFHIALQAIDILHKSLPDTTIRYRLVGDGPLRNQLQHLARDLSIEGLIQFVGAIDREDVVREMQQAHILILSSQQEVLPTVLLEAQACQLPIIATRVGATDEAVLPNQSAFLVPPDDPNALAQTLRYLLQNPNLWPQMGQAGRRFVEENYDIRILNTRLLDIYRQLIDRKQPHPPRTPKSKDPQS